MMEAKNQSVEIAAFDIPILLIIFNRPETTRKVFEVIRQRKPKYFFVAADGPRKEIESDNDKCIAARAIVQVDWDCEFHTLYCEENRGCGHGPAEAISWFFEYVDEGIILEDDVLPGPGYFEFMQEMLSTFRNDSRVNMVSGLNLAQHWPLSFNNSIFTLFGGSAGWGTWKRAWKFFDYEMKEWKSGNRKLVLREKLNNKSYFEYFTNLFDTMSAQIGNDFWDYQWLYARLAQGGYCIIPKVNLVENIGFGDDASHTVLPNHPQAHIRHGKMKLPVSKPSIRGNKLYDRYIFERFMNTSARSLYKKLILRVVRFLFTTK